MPLFCPSCNSSNLCNNSPLPKRTIKSHVFQTKHLNERQIFIVLTTNILYDERGRGIQMHSNYSYRVVSGGNVVHRPSATDANCNGNGAKNGQSIYTIENPDEKRDPEKDSGLGSDMSNHLRNWTRRTCNKKQLKKRIPITSWLPNYSVNFALSDLIAGVTVGLTVIPQGIAYALVANLPPQYGLYSAFMGCFAYIFFGTSKVRPVDETGQYL